MPGKMLRIVAVNLLVLAGLLLVLEAINQILGISHPAYYVVFLEPDRVVGWKQVPGLHWTWTTADFSVPIDTNPLGFRDLPREVAKRQGVKRVVLLGDSFIEAVQVPLPKTGGQLLEYRLNEGAATRPEGSRRWEVLNFGISGYGIGQYLLAWERYAASYRPDVIVAFVSWLQMRRTIVTHEYGAFAATKQESLWIRPTFRVENGVLIREPARDFARFRQAQATLIARELGEHRSRRKGRSSITFSAIRLINDRLTGMFSVFAPLSALKSPLPVRAPAVDGAAVWSVNERVLCELGRQVEESGARFVILDVDQYLFGDQALSTKLETLCSNYGFGYIPLYRDLLAANRKGVATHWPHDGHFNEAGNRILSDAIYEWIRRAS